jgi:hypothetical protein
MKKVIILISMILLPIISTQPAQADWRYLYTQQELDNFALGIKQQVLRMCYVNGVPVLSRQPAAAKGNKVNGKVFRPDSTGGLMTKEFINNPANAEYMKWWYSLTESGNLPHPLTGNKRNEFSPCVGIVNGTLDIDQYAKDSTRWIRRR